MNVDPRRRALIGLNCRSGAARAEILRSLIDRFGFTTSDSVDCDDSVDVVVEVDDWASFDRVRSRGGLLVAVAHHTAVDDFGRGDVDWDVVVVDDGTLEQLGGLADVLVDLADDSVTGSRLWEGSRVRFSAAATAVG